MTERPGSDALHLGLFGESYRVMDDDPEERLVTKGLLADRSGLEFMLDSITARKMKE